MCLWMEVGTLPQQSDGGGSAAVTAAAVRTDGRADTRRCCRPPRFKPLSLGAAVSPASFTENHPGPQPLNHDVRPWKDDSRLLRLDQDVGAAAESADGNVAAFRLEQAGSFTQAAT